MRPLPSFQLELMNSIDFVLSSPIGRLALSDTSCFPDVANMLRDIMEDIDRLAKNCHLPEFTDHALPHVCSLVNRLSVWGNGGWLKGLNAREAAFLLFATLTHDLGMLSQDPMELESTPDQTPKGLSELSDWVRRTHVSRLRGLLRRLLERQGRGTLIATPEFDLWEALGAAHQTWPWEEPHGFTRVATLARAAGIGADKARGLAALIAVADLLDEDSSRCDTATLIKHRLGTTLNRAHWLRHGLTQDRVQVQAGKVAVNFVNVPQAPRGMDQVFRALRNHFRLVLLYNSELASLGAEISGLEFLPCTGAATQTNDNLSGWTAIEEFGNCLPEQLLMTFMREARGDVTDAAMVHRLTTIGVEILDLSSFRAFRGEREALSDEERVFLSSLRSY